MLTMMTKEAYQAAREAYLPQGKQFKSFPILTHMLLTNDPTGVYLAMVTFDEDGEKVVSLGVCRAKWDGERFETCIPSRAFKDWLNVTRKYTDRIQLTYDPSVNVLEIRADNTRAEFRCMPTYEFPPV